MPLVTIFTPVYNRAGTIRNLYNSLREQKNKDFEWIIVDDGSTDCTPQILEQIANENDSFPIIYKKQSNQGKHIAINLGVSLAKGKLFFIVDSDDVLTDDAVNKIIDWAIDLPEQGFAGMVFLKASKENGTVWGSTFKGKSKDFTSLERYKNGVTGDKAEIYYTDVLKKFPFPCFEQERFVTEALVWNRIAASGLKMRWINEIVYLSNYLEDGLTKKIDNILFDNYFGYTQYVKELIHYPQTSFIEKFKAIGMYAVRSKRKGACIQSIKRNISASSIIIICSYLCAKFLRK